MVGEFPQPSRGNTAKALGDFYLKDQGLSPMHNPFTKPYVPTIRDAVYPLYPQNPLSDR